MPGVDMCSTGPVFAFTARCSVEQKAHFAKQTPTDFSTSGGVVRSPDTQQTVHALRTEKGEIYFQWTNSTPKGQGTDTPDFTLGDGRSKADVAGEGGTF